jgi:phage baseplate assembly protein W
MTARSAIGMQASTGVAINGVDHLMQSIHTILTTPVGSRVMRRSFGSLLPELIDQPDNAATRVRVFAAVAGALMRWEPRLRISRVQLASGAPGQAELVLDGTYMPSDGPQQLLALRVPLQARAAT